MKLENLIKKYLIKCELQNNLDPKTLKAYRLDLKQFLNFMSGRTEFYKKENITEYIYNLSKQGYAIKTIKRKVASVKAFFSFLDEEEMIEFNPFYKIKLKMKEPMLLPKIIPVREMTSLFECMYKELEKCDKKTYKYKELVRNIAVIELLIGTGIRIGELCTLKKENICWEVNMMKIYGKGAKERMIPLFYPSILNALVLYTKVFEKELKGSEYFFINKRNNPLSSQSVRNMIKKYCNCAGIKLHITPHMFRHTFATMLLDDDVDSRNIQMLLGHSSITTTQIYTHVTSNKRAEIMKYKNPRSKIGVNGG